MRGKTKTTLAATALGVGLFAVSAAGVAQDGRFYAGGSLGQAELDGFCSDVDGILASVGGTLRSCDEKDTAWKIFGGYRINPNFAVEGTYIDFGEVSARGASFGVPFTARADATGLGVAAVGILPLAERFSLFGKLGLLRTEGDVSASGAGGSVSDSESEIGLHLGIGALFDVGQTFSIRAEWERDDENEIDMMSIGGQFRF